MPDRAVVEAVLPLMVRYDAGDNAVPAESLSSYTPVVGDRVAVDRLGGQVVVLGTTGPTPPVPVSGQPWTVHGSTVGTPNGSGQLTITYGVTFTTAPWPVTSPGSTGVATALGSGSTTSAGYATLYDFDGTPVITGSRRVNWIVNGIVA